MIKIYNATNLHGNIILNDYIDFEFGKFNTGTHGFGEVISSNINCKRVNYELQTLKYYEQYLKMIKKQDGFVEDFVLWNPKNYEMLLEQYGDVPKDFKSYEEYGLNEEAILLFTNFINVRYERDELVTRIFGRFPEVGLYLLKPNASINLVPSLSSEEQNYEVLQSKGLGKRLVLQKMDRKI